METLQPSFRGKVRDVYDLGDRLLFVATDRISAYDCVLPREIPHKGEVLTALSLYWFERTRHIVENHFLSAETADIDAALGELGLGADAADREPAVGTGERTESGSVEPAGACPREWFHGRSIIVTKAEVVPIECVVRGYLAGSAWSEYEESGTVCGATLPAGLRESDRLDEPIFTPATKAATGHDENISLARMEQAVGGQLADALRSLSVAVYEFARNDASQKGIIIADTKFEFGLVRGDIVLVDEVLTPDSSRFWPVDSYQPGRGQPSFDKQFVRDWLDGVGWNHTPPPPELPDDVVAKTSEKYLQAYELITGSRLQA